MALNFILKGGTAIRVLFSKRQPLKFQVPGEYRLRLGQLAKLGAGKRRIVPGSERLAVPLSEEPLPVSATCLSNGSA